MTGTAHALIGATIGYKIGNPYLSFPIAFVSHFLVDKVPHWDVMTDHTKSKTKIVFQSAMDVIISTALVFVFATIVGRPTGWTIYMAAFLAQLPDWMEIPKTIFKKDLPFAKQNYQFQKWVHDVGFNARCDAPLGVLTQVVAVLAFLLWASH